MIIFRRIQKPVPTDWLPGAHWYVEYYCDDWANGYPSGMAFVTAIKSFVFLDFIFVADHERRKGIATELLHACRQKWPGIDYGDGISKSGAALLKSVQSRRKKRNTSTLSRRQRHL